MYFLPHILSSIVLGLGISLVRFASVSFKMGLASWHCTALVIFFCGILPTTYQRTICLEIFPSRWGSAKMSWHFVITFYHLGFLAVACISYHKAIFLPPTSKMYSTVFHLSAMSGKWTFLSSTTVVLKDVPYCCAYANLSTP